jgi:hypothetical protein
MKQHMSIYPLIFEHEFGFGEGNGDSGGISVNKIPFRRQLIPVIIALTVPTQAFLFKIPLIPKNLLTANPL